MIEQILSDCRAMLRGHFVLTSGRHSEYYVEKIKIINNPKYVEILCEQLAKKLSNYDCDIVVGPAFGGIVLAYEVAKQLGKRFVFTQRKDDMMTIRSGFDICPSDRAIIIEDIITTGGSVREVIALLNSMQIDIQAIGSIVDRSGGKVDFGIDHIALHTMNIETFAADDCPLCRENIPLFRPGASDKK